MVETRPPLIIVGAGPQGRIIREVCQVAEIDVLGFLDDTFAVGALVDGAPVLGSFGGAPKCISSKASQFIVALGDCEARLTMWERISSQGVTPTTVRHPLSFTSPTAQVGPGSFINFATAIYSGARIGAAFILDTHASIGHDCTIGDGVFVGPGARMAGGVRCGRGTFIGLAAIILPGVEIGQRVVVGAGAVVTRNVPDGAIVAGNPARPMPGSADA